MSSLVRLLHSFVTFLPQSQYLLIHNRGYFTIMCCIDRLFSTRFIYTFHELKINIFQISIINNIKYTIIMQYYTRHNSEKTKVAKKA